MKLGNQILVGVSAGLALGVFFGELCEPLSVAGEVYVGLLQMTVLPYVVLALVTRIGRLSWAQAGVLARFSGGVLGALWAISLVAVLALALALPPWDAGTFFSSSLVSVNEGFDFTQLFIPANPFSSRSIPSKGTRRMSVWRLPSLRWTTSSPATFWR